MSADFTALLPAIIVAIIGFLIRHSFAQFSDHLDTITSDIKEVKELIQHHDSRLSSVETALRMKGVDL